MSGREFFESEGPDAGDDISATVQIDEEQIFGSEVNEPGSAASIESASEISFGPDIEAELRERAEKIQSVDNDPDIPDMFEDDKYRSIERAEDALSAVFRRGSGAFSSTSVEGVSRAQWSFGRTADFADIVMFNEPDDPDYVQDNDLLPDGHPLAVRDDETPFVEGVPNEEELVDVEGYFESE